MVVFSRPSLSSLLSEEFKTKRVSKREERTCRRCVCWSRREQARPRERERENHSKSALGGGGGSGGKLASSGATKKKEKEKETRVFFCLGICCYGMSKRTRRKREGAKAQTSSNKRVNSERENALWRLATNYPDIFDAHVVTKLNGNDIKFFYDVNSESRAAIKRAGAQVPDAFKIGDFDTKSTLSWALEKCSEKKERFCA